MWRKDPNSPSEWVRPLQARTNCWLNGWATHFKLWSIFFSCRINHNFWFQYFCRRQSPETVRFAPHILLDSYGVVAIDWKNSNCLRLKTWSIYRVHPQRQYRVHWPAAVIVALLLRSCVKYNTSSHALFLFITRSNTLPHSLNKNSWPVAMAMATKHALYSIVSFPDPQYGTRYWGSCWGSGNKTNVNINLQYPVVVYIPTSTLIMHENSRCFSEALNFS